MNGLVFICILFCGVSGFNDFSGSASNASASLSETVHTAKDALDIKRELDVIRKNRKRTVKKRERRGSDSSYRSFNSDTNKVTAGIAAILKTYVYQPIAHGNFQESTIRAYNIFDYAEGKFVFGTLDGELNQSFRSIMIDRHPRTGDIISCRIPTDRMAEHYMMVINNKIAEVGVVGGKTTHNGVIAIDSYRKSSYINSTECLYHENRLISRAQQIDERNGDDKETDLRYEEILNRLDCTINGRNSGQFNYDVLRCNCQDLVLYWAYGYMENNCLATYFNGCSTYLAYSLFQISGYVDETKHLQNHTDEWRGILNAINLIGNGR